MTHFVYVYHKFSDKWEELKYSMKSIRKFFNGDYRIFVVGDKPNFHGGYTHVPHTAIKNKMFAKTMDSFSKLRTICNTKDINEDFVYMYDDQVFIKPFSESHLWVTVANDHVDDLKGYWERPGTKPSQQWRNIFRNTIMELQENKYSTWNYETHLPKMLSKEKVKHILDFYACEKKAGTWPMLFSTLYFNTGRRNPDVSLDREEVKIKAGIYRAREYKGIVDQCRDMMILNYDDYGLNLHLKRFIQEITHE